MHLIESILADAASIAAMRRDIHAHPEIGFEETRTAAMVAEKLDAWGIEVHRGVGKTGVVGVLRAGSSRRRWRDVTRSTAIQRSRMVMFG